MTVKMSPEEIENKRKRHLILTFAVLGCIFLGIFGVISLLDGRYQLGTVLFLFLALGVLIALRAPKIINVQPLAMFLSTTLCFLSIFLLVDGGNEGTGVYWSYPISMLMVLMAGPRVGVALMAIFFVGSSIFLLGPFDVTYDYTYVQRTRILAAALAQFMLVIASEWIRFGSYKAITLTSKAHQNFANTDSLTQTLNRHGLKQALDKRCTDDSAVIVLLDVDNFKRINDTYGHDIGDDVLEALASIIETHAKGGDLVARWGGEEFLIVLFDTDLPQAKALTTKIKDEFSRQDLLSNDDTSLVTTFSAGIAPMQSLAEFSESIKVADTLLYQAKNNGRNQIIIAEAQAQFQAGSE